jgi:hypothetical protein
MPGSAEPTAIATGKTLRWGLKNAGSLDLYDPPKIYREFEFQIIFMAEDYIQYLDQL